MENTEIRTAEQRTQAQIPNIPIDNNFSNHCRNAKEQDNKYLYRKNKA